MARLVAPNPWSGLSPARYEAEMGPLGADLLAPLAAIFEKVYAARRPRRLAVLGVGPGTGLEHVDPSVTSRAVGVDANLAFLAVARQRHLRLGATLQLFCAEPSRAELQPGAFDLVHAPLVLAHVDVDEVAPRLAGSVAPDGGCSAILSLAAPPSPAGAPPADPEELRRALADEGLVERRAYDIWLSGGRRLFAALWVKPP